MTDSTENTQPRRRGITRRRFLRWGGIALGGAVASVYFGRNAIRRYVHHRLATAEGGIVLIDNFEPFLLFEMQPDNTLMINAPYAEMGQGIFGGFALLAAEELDLRVDQINVRPLPYDSMMVDNGATGGSGTTRAMYTPMREIAATMREMLKSAAAAQWGVDVATVQTSEGMLSAGGQSISYIDLINSTDVATWEVPEEAPELRSRSEWKVIGTEHPRADLVTKVMGDPIYALDYELPNMAHANLLKCPYVNGTIESMDVDAAMAVPGVIEIFQDTINGAAVVAVVAENRFAAEQGKKALNTKWTVPQLWQEEEIRGLTTVGNPAVSPVSLQRDGRASRIIDSGGGTTVSAEYRVATGVHAQMEPNSALADVQGDSAFCVTSSQGAGLMVGAIASATGLDAENIKIQNAYLGGGFGRKVALNPVIEAAVISQKIGRPVQVIWDRETEFLCGLVRPPTHHAFRAQLDGSGKVTAIEHHLASGSQIIDILAEAIPGGEIMHGFLGADLMSASHGATFMYDFPAMQTDMWHVSLPFATGIWRGVGMYPNGFAVESFIDEVAVAAGQDPFDFRMAHISAETEQGRRYRDVLTRLRAESGWDEPKAPNVGRGLAIIDDRLTVCAAVIEVEVVDERIHVRKVTHVTDCGVVVNPDGIRQQVEGCIMMGLSATLYEETLMQDSTFNASNYHQYPMALLRHTPPEINVILMEGSEKISGIGEPPIGPIPAGIANAVYDAIGQRLREIPLQKSLSGSNLA